MDKLLGVLMCKDFGFQEMIMKNPLTHYRVTGLIFNAEGKLALINHLETASYELPSYAVTNKEVIEDVLKDKLLNITGTIIELYNLVGSYEERRSYNNTIILSKVYLATIKRDKTHPVYKDKNISSTERIVWIGIEEALDLLTKNIIKEKKEELTAKEASFNVRKQLEILSYYHENHYKKKGK